MRIKWGILIILFTVNFSGYAQFVTIGSEQQLWVTEGAIVSVKGSMENNGVLVNNGSISVSENWANNNIYNAGLGTFIFDGTSIQSINHNGQSFYNLELRGGGKKTLRENADILNEVVFNNGILTPASGDSLIVNEDASVSGGNESSYYNGNLFHRGTGYKYFPIGKNGNYRPVEFLDVRGVDPLIGLEMKEPNPPARLGEKLDSLSKTRYWQLHRVAGSFESTLVKLSVNNDEGFENIEGVVVAQADTTGGLFKNIGQASATGTANDGRVTSDSVFNANILALGITSEFSLSEMILVPSAFSPSAIDPENRTVNIFGVELAQQGFSFKIFNKWGDLVYQTNSIDEALNTGWNGEIKNTGNPAPRGVYHYILNATFLSGKSIEKSGTITLFR